MAHKILGMERRERNRLNGVTEIYFDHLLVVVPRLNFKKEEIKWDFVVAREGKVE